MDRRQDRSDELNIREMSDKYRCSLRALRFYEEIGLLVPRRAGSSRVYTPEDESIMKMIQCGKRLGLSLQEISNLLLSKKNNTLSERLRIEGLTSLLPKQQIAQQIVVLTQRRKGLDLAIAELKEAHQRF